MNLAELQELINLYKEKHYFYKDDELELVSEKKTVKIYKLDGYYFKFKNGKLDCCWLDDDPMPITIEEWKEIVEDEDIAYEIQADEENEALGNSWKNVVFVSAEQAEGDNDEGF